MATLLRIVRAAFGIEAITALVTIAAFWGPFTRIARNGHWSMLMLVGLVLLFLGLAFTAGMAWWALRSGRAAAKWWLLAASILNLPLLGLGTLVGVSGLVLFRRYDRIAQITAQQLSAAQSLPGDGTFKYGGAITQTVQLVWMVGATTWFWNWAGKHGLDQSGGWLVYLVQVEGAMLLNTILHESGHVLGGWASGMKVRTFAFGPVRFSKRKGVWRVEFQAAGLWGSGAAGLVATELRDIRRKRIVTMLAGPVASLVTAIAATTVVFMAPGRPWGIGWQFFALLSTFAWASAIVNMIPLQPENEYSDGAQIYQLMSDGPWADVHTAFSMVASSLVTPLRPRQFDTWTLTRAARFLKHGERGLLLQLFLYMHHKDAGRPEQAQRALDEAEKLYPSVAARLHADLHADFVFGNALLRRDARAAAEWWKRLESRGNSRKELDYWKAKAAFHWIEGSMAEARDAWAQASTLVQKLPAVGAYIRDREEVAEIGRLLHESASSNDLTALKEATGQQGARLLRTNPALAES
ncbi:MAG: site-2 protease family protein [Bryobacteraceae bacterium]